MNVKRLKEILELIPEDYTVTTWDAYFDEETDVVVINQDEAEQRCLIFNNSLRDKYWK